MYLEHLVFYGRFFSAFFRLCIMGMVYLDVAFDADQSYDSDSLHCTFYIAADL